jgi:hypothetical protein
MIWACCEYKTAEPGDFEMGDTTKDNIDRFWKLIRLLVFLWLGGANFGAYFGILLNMNGKVHAAVVGLVGMAAGIIITAISVRAIIKLFKLVSESSADREEIPEII